MFRDLDPDDQKIGYQMYICKVIQTEIFFFDLKVIIKYSLKDNDKKRKGNKYDRKNCKATSYSYIVFFSIKKI